MFTQCGRQRGLFAIASAAKWVILERLDMSNLVDEFWRIANAERRLCDEAGPVLSAVIRDIASNAAAGN